MAKVINFPRKTGFNLGLVEATRQVKAPNHGNISLENVAIKLEQALCEYFIAHRCGGDIVQAGMQLDTCRSDLRNALLHRQLA